jgi:hypothetical protein
MAALVSGILAGCGGGTTTYTNDEYGVSFDYDGGMFTETSDTSAAGSVGGDAVFKIGFFDTDGTKTGDQYRDGFVLNLYKLNTTIDESLMPAVKDELEKLLPELAKAFGSGADFSSLEAIDVDGTSGFTADATYEMDGTDFKATMYFLIKDDMEYQLTMQGAASRWSELEPGFQQVIDTFAVK